MNRVFGWAIAALLLAAPQAPAQNAGRQFNVGTLNGTTYTNNVNVGQDIPSEFYSTRVSSSMAWINSVIDFLPGKDLVITAVTPAGTNIQISFTTGTNKVYEIERRDSFNSGNWTVVTNGIVGTGGIMSITDVGAATLPKRFYRLGLMPVLP